jgi:hypothetical protein
MRRPEETTVVALYRHNREVNNRSEGNDDLTELTTVLEISVHFHHIVEFECAINDRLERTNSEALGDVVHCGRPGFSVACISRIVGSHIGADSHWDGLRGSCKHSRQQHHRQLCADWHQPVVL